MQEEEAITTGMLSKTPGEAQETVLFGKTTLRALRGSRVSIETT